MSKNKFLIPVLILLLAVFCSCSGEEPVPDDLNDTPENITGSSEDFPADIENTGEEIPERKSEVEILISQMTLEQKIGQMFFLAFRQDENGENITRINNNIKNIIENFGIGGIVLFSENIREKNQVIDYIESLQEISDIKLFIAIDEEGGRVLRTRNLDVPRISSALSIGRTGDAQYAYDAAAVIAGYLSPLGFNVNFAPVADVFTNSENTVIGDRAFSADPYEAGKFVESFTKGLLENNILPALKHFPGHGDTVSDSHFGAASTKKTLEELFVGEFIPFNGGIAAGAPFVMTGHISAPNITGNHLPATFSEFLLKNVLRKSLGFENIIISDALEMGAVAQYYNNAETAVNAVAAGVDMLLMPNNFREARDGLLNAVKSGELSEEKIDESVKRILNVKYNAGLLNITDR
ncbi:MAG: glycoside hydrolase family 3 protein [Oscillospiraceae bacterium]|nr:glycoside hydrolase family 3 protein [Oscillospiraceae bacterium]